MTSLKSTNQQYPKGFFPLLFVLLFFMVAFALIQSLLVLYCTSALQFTDSNAYSLYAAYGSLVFGGPLLGGYLGGNILGYKPAAQTGLILSVLGLFCLALPEKSLFYIGLSFFVMGASLTVPNLYCLISQLYNFSEGKRESGFTLAYMGMNLGGFFAMAASGTLQQHFGYHTDFLVGATSLCIALIVFSFYQHTFIENKSFTLHYRLQKTLGFTAVVFAIPLWLFLLQHTSACNHLLLAMGACTFAYGCYAAKHEHGLVRQKLLLFLMLLIVCVAFWSLYMLSPTALTLFIDRNVDRHFFNFVIPTSSIMSLNPFFIVTVGILFNAMYLRATKQSVSVTTKIASGTLLMGLGYLVLVLGIHAANANGYTALGWVVFSYFLQTAGELFVGPIGFAMVGNLVPARLEGTMMGMWQLCVGVSSVISGYLARSTTVDNHLTKPVQTNPGYAHAFNHFGSLSASIALVTFVVIVAQRHYVNAKHKPSNVITA